MKYVPPVGGADDAAYVDADPASGVEGSAVPAAAIEHPMRELEALIEDAGLTPSKSDLSQVVQAIRHMLQRMPSSTAVASGTADVITATFTPTISALTSGMTLYVRAAYANATTTPTFTPASGTIAAKTIVKGAGAALAAGDIAGGGHWIELQWDVTLDKWVLLNPATGVSVTSSAAVQGTFKNLQISAGGTAASISVSCDEVVLGDGAGNYVGERNVSGTITTTNTGAGGLDTGTLAASTWYSIWRIGKSDGTRAWLFSLSATAPTMPSGYTLKARIGWFRTDATNKYPLAFTQKGRRVQYTPTSGSNLTTLPQMAIGTAGSASTPTWVAVAWGSFAPSTAAALHLTLRNPAAAGSVLIIAPNNSYGGYATTTNPPPFTAAGGSGVDMTTLGTIIPESSNIYWASAGSANNSVWMFGWDDNI